MEPVDFFKFEDKDRDFPVYNNNPSISIIEWVVLLLLLLPGLLLTMGTSFLAGIGACLVLGVPLLYFLNWDYTLLFQKPKKKDVLLAVGLFIGYLFYASAISYLLSSAHINSVSTSPLPTLMTIPPLVFSLMAEELFKLIPFLFLLRVTYKYSHNRKLAVVLSTILIMLLFALIHSYSWEMFIVAIFYQGLGSIFEIAGYIKTKNVLIPYITHLCTDVFLMLLVIIAPSLF